MFRATNKYEALSQDAGDVKMHTLNDHPLSAWENDDLICYHCAISKQRDRSSFWKFTVKAICIILLSLLALTGACDILYHFKNGYSPASVKDHMKATSNYSPLFDALDMNLENRVFNGSLFSRNTSGIFRQPPSPEVDEAWARISATPPFAVGRDAIEKIGKDPALAVKIPKSWGEGEKYFVQLEAHHQMHCLNELRKQAYAHHYYPGGSHHPLHWIHIAHCLDILRQVIMCSASVDLITFNWRETQQGGFPDFYVAHQCRDYEATMKWAEEQKQAWRLDDRIDDLLEPPVDAVVLPMEPEYYDYLPAMAEYRKSHPLADGHYGGHH